MDHWHDYAWCWADLHHTFKSDFLVYLKLVMGGKSESSIAKILILDFYYFLRSLWFIITYLNQFCKWTKISPYMGIH
jgi:hypothetical protein